MNLKKINWFLIIFAIISIPLFYYISENSGLLQGKIINNKLMSILRKSPNVVYDLNIPLQNHMITRMKTYEPIARKISKEDIEFFRKHLDIKENIKETSTQYILQNETKQMIISKTTGLIEYNSFNEKNIKNNKISKDIAIKIVIDFIEGLNLSCHYKTGLVEDLSNKDMYKVRFVNTIEGILNYGYCTTAHVSYEGEILNLECHEVIYKPREIVPIKSVKEAYSELLKIPVDDDNVQIDIKKADLVYIHTSDDMNKNNGNAIEPAYRFFGETNKGNAFEYFISAIDL